VQANGDGVQITVFGKGGKTRTIQLPASVAAPLAKLRGAKACAPHDSFLATPGAVARADSCFGWSGVGKAVMLLSLLMVR
jgi:hypothetical protein